MHYPTNDGLAIKKHSPWSGDIFSFLYDYIMETSIFPKKFGGDINRHYQILRNELKNVHHQNVLESGTGSGSAIEFLPYDNSYTGCDISTGLLRKAVKRFKRSGFEKAAFYVASADDLPFDNNTFELIICILSLNFFKDIQKVFTEIKRVISSNGVLLCCVPVPERNRLKRTIRGNLYSEETLESICKKNGFCYQNIPAENGALLYFKAII